MNEQQKDNIYYSTDFAKLLSEIRENKNVLDTKEKLVDFWITAYDSRNSHKAVQEFIATEAAREFGSVSLDESRDRRYIDVIEQFLNMDHMYESYPESDKEWDKLGRMLQQLKINA